MPNPICHFEIGVKDGKRAGEFYSKVFDWTMEEKGGVTMLRTGEDVSGHFNTHGHGPKNYTIFYIMVDDVPAALKRAEAAGGKTVFGPMAEGPGTFAWFTDPEGNTIGVYSEPKKS